MWVTDYLLINLYKILAFRIKLDNCFCFMAKWSFSLNTCFFSHINIFYNLDTRGLVNQILYHVVFLLFNNLIVLLSWYNFEVYHLILGRSMRLVFLSFTFFITFSISPIQVFRLLHDIATNWAIALKVPFYLLFTLRSAYALVYLVFDFLLLADFIDLDLFSDLFVIVYRFHSLFNLTGVYQLKVICLFC